MRRTAAVALGIGALVGIALAVVPSNQGADNGRIETVLWSRSEKIDGHTVRLFATGYHSPSCYEPDPNVNYSPDAITIRLRFRRTGEFCTLENGIGDQPVVVDLDQDLGTRPIRQG